MDAWCPCSVQWSSFVLQDGFATELLSNRTYPVVDDLYGPLLKAKLLTPRGAKADSPSPTCTPLTPPSASAEANLRQSRAFLSSMEDVSSSLLIELDEVVTKALLQEDHFFQMGNDIEEQVRLHGSRLVPCWGNANGTV